MQQRLQLMPLAKEGRMELVDALERVAAILSGAGNILEFLHGVVKLLFTYQPISNESKKNTDNKNQPLDKRIIKNSIWQSHLMNKIERKKP